MKARVGLLALMMTAAGLFIQPVTAAAEDLGHDQHARVERQNDARFVRQYREPVVHREDNRRDKDARYRAPNRRDLPPAGFRR